MGHIEDIEYTIFEHEILKCSSLEQWFILFLNCLSFFRTRITQIIDQTSIERYMPPIFGQAILNITDRNSQQLF